MNVKESSPGEKLYAYSDLKNEFMLGDRRSFLQVNVYSSKPKGT